MTKLFSGIIGILIVLACAKDTPTEVPLHESIVGVRTSEYVAQLFLGSMTVWNYDTKTQIVINKDSLQSVELAKINRSNVNISNPTTGQSYKAAQWRVLFKFKNGSNDYSGVYFVKDSSKTFFAVKPSGSIGVAKSIELKQTESFKTYYDYRFMRTKRTYLYEIKTDSLYSEQNLTAWHHPNSSIFFLDHKH